MARWPLVLGVAVLGIGAGCASCHSAPDGPDDVLAGSSMADVIRHNAHLSQEDCMAIAAYVKVRP